MSKANEKTETATTSAPANEKTETAQTETATTIAPAFKRTKRVNLPLLKLGIDVPVYVVITKAMYEGKEMKGSRDAARMDAATLLDVKDLSEKDEFLQAKSMIVHVVLKCILEENYAGDKYVGQSFEIIKHAKDTGKPYNPFSVAEIELE